MSVTIMRTNTAWWVLTMDGPVRLETHARTTGELLEDRTALQSLRTDGATPRIDTIDGAALLSPVTTPCRVVAQMTNSVSHVEDTGGDASRAPVAFFRISSCSIGDPFTTIAKPGHVKLLDYEVEIGLVIGKRIPVGTRIAAGELAEYVAGLVIADDVSARDVQLPFSQYYEAKSYPNFTPVGPYLVLLEERELRRFEDLRLRLWVNGELRQDRHVVGDMIHPPLVALNHLARFQQLDPGDLILTGTPCGTAVSAPRKPLRILASLLPESLRWKLFIRQQTRNQAYLKAGDVVEAAIATDDGALDLGRQRTVITQG